MPQLVTGLVLAENKPSVFPLARAAIVCGGQTIHVVSSLQKPAFDSPLMDSLEQNVLHFTIRD